MVWPIIGAEILGRERRQVNEGVDVGYVPKSQLMKNLDYAHRPRGQFSMSSIKRDVKKKVLPRPEVEKIFVSRSSPLSVSAPRFRSRGFALACLPFPWVSSSGGDDANRVLRTWQADLVLECQPWFYRRLVAYRYFWLSEAAYRVMGDSVPKHTGPISLTDTHLEPSVSRTRPTTIGENHRRWKGLLPETLKRLADAIVWRRNLLLSSKWLT